MLIALAHAGDAGLNVEPRVLGSANFFLTEQLDQVTDVAAENDASWRAMIQYAITRAGWDSATSSTRALFEQERDQLQNWGRAYLLIALLENEDEAAANQEAIRALINDLSIDAISSANGTHWEDPPADEYMQNDLVTATLVLRALVAAEPDHPLIEGTVRWLVVARSAGRWQQRHERAQALQKNSRFFCDALKARDIDTGLAIGESPVVPAITGDSMQALHLSQRLLAADINAKPIVFPAVANDAARLRFFMTALHTEEQLTLTADAVARILAEVRKDLAR